MSTMVPSARPLELSQIDCASSVWERTDPEARWYAAYTCANHEKSVASQLAEREISHYLPLYQSVRQWKDRKKVLDLPLFPGYVFVQISPRERLRVVQVHGLVRLVGFGGEPVALPEGEIATVRACLEQKWRIEPHPFLRTGQRVRIVRGVLEGTEGILIRKKGLYRLVLSVGLILRAVAVEVDVTDVEPTSGKEGGYPIPHFR